MGCFASAHFLRDSRHDPKFTDPTAGATTTLAPWAILTGDLDGFEHVPRR
jgi:hypothetical protein